ncbi:MAG TPA: TspO/MBR family protein, partial [Sedimentisphaerales bacterium]|nr:TspO/MBR family protein [Sedimentisphaerales bacterium]
LAGTAVLIVTLLPYKIRRVAPACGIFVLISLLAGLVGSMFTATSVRTWYATLNRPALTPPGWVFGPVWTALYIMMGIAAGLVWSKGIASPAVKAAIAAFIIQLILNALWSFLFFGLQSPLYGLIDIIALWFAIAVTIFLFRRVDLYAALLLVPYLLWVTFATFLNIRIWQLNP